MQPLDSGESPVLTLRVPRQMMARISRLAGTRRGDRAIWHRAVIERALAEGVTLADLRDNNEKEAGSD